MDRDVLRCYGVLGFYWREPVRGAEVIDHGLDGQGGIGNFAIPFVDGVFDVLDASAFAAEWIDCQKLG